MKNSLLLMLGVFVGALSCTKKDTQTDSQADSAVTYENSYDSANIAPAPPENQTDTTNYRNGSDTLKQSKQRNDSITR